MYTTTTATREFALKAAAAAERALNRGACCKSQFKFKCFSCGEMINRGDNITRCIRTTTGMKLRYRGADATHGLSMDETVFYLGETGNNTWVHVGCIPCFWHNGLDEDGNRLTRPRLRPICTEWGVKVYGEFEEWCESTSPDDEVLPHFRLMKGYPKEKLSERPHRSRGQAIPGSLARIHLQKRLIQALRAARATEALNLNAYATLSIPPLCSQNAQKRNDFLHQNSIGAQMEILMDKNHPSVAFTVPK